MLSTNDVAEEDTAIEGTDSEADEDTSAIPSYINFIKVKCEDCESKDLRSNLHFNPTERWARQYHRRMKKKDGKICELAAKMIGGRGRKRLELSPEQIEERKKLRLKQDRERQKTLYWKRKNLTQKL